MVNWRWSLFWAAVFAVGGAGELVAVLNAGAGDTLSEQVWAVLGLGQAAWLAGLGAFTGGFAVLLYHFFFRRGG